MSRSVQDTQCSGLDKRDDLLGRAERSKDMRNKSILDVSKKQSTSAPSTPSAAAASAAQSPATAAPSASPLPSPSPQRVMATSSDTQTPTTSETGGVKNLQSRLNIQLQQQQLQQLQQKQTPVTQQSPSINQQTPTPPMAQAPPTPEGGGGVRNLQSRLNQQIQQQQYQQQSSTPQDTPSPQAPEGGSVRSGGASYYRRSVMVTPSAGGGRPQMGPGGDEPQQQQLQQSISMPSSPMDSSANLASSTGSTNSIASTSSSVPQSPSVMAAPPQKLVSTGSTPTMPVRGSAAARLGHKKNQSMPDMNGLRTKRDSYTDTDDTSTSDSGNETPPDEDDVMMYRERSRPRGFRIKDPAVEWDSGVVEYKPKASVRENQPIAMGSRKTTAFVESPVAPIEPNEERAQLVPSDEPAAPEQATTGSRLAGKLRDIKKKAGVVGTLTKNKMSEVATKAKSKLNKDQPGATSPGGAASTDPAPVNMNAIFAQPLLVAITRSARLHPLLPDLVFKSIEYLRERGIKEEGIFRLSGSASAINALKTDFDNGVDVDLNPVLDQHVVSGILKLYLRQIPETLFTEEFSDTLEGLRQGGNSPDAINMRISGITALLKRLPEANRCILHHLNSLLNLVSFEPSSKMTTVNLAIIFAPTLGCPVEVMTVLIDYYEPIFAEQTYSYIN
eukprot:gene15368-18229_t